MLSLIRTLAYICASDSALFLLRSSRCIVNDVSESLDAARRRESVCVPAPTKIASGLSVHLHRIILHILENMAICSQNIKSHHVALYPVYWICSGMVKSIPMSFAIFLISCTCSTDAIDVGELVELLLNVEQKSPS